MALPVILAAIAIGAEVGKIYYQNQDRLANEDALDLQAKQHQIVYQQKQLANISLMKRVLETQTAEASARGVGLGSSSLMAIQRHTFEIGGKENKNLETEKSLVDYNNEVEKSNVKDRFYSQLFGDVISGASALYSANAKG